jgi:hypothetical protein
MFAADCRVCEYDLSSRQWTDLSVVTPGLIGRGCVDCAGGFYWPVDQTVRRLDRRTGVCSVVAGSADTRRTDAADPLSAAFLVITCMAAAPDGSRLFVVDFQAIRQIDFRPDSATRGITTLYTTDCVPQFSSMCWLSSERLLIGDRSGCVRVFDLLSRECDGVQLSHSHRCACGLTGAIDRYRYRC